MLLSFYAMTIASKLSDNTNNYQIQYITVSLIAIHAIIGGYVHSGSNVFWPIYAVVLLSIKNIVVLVYLICIFTFGFINVFVFSEVVIIEALCIAV